MKTLPRLLSSALIAAAIFAPRLAAADGALRTVLVIDASSSMRGTDPKELRKVAAELFVDLTRNGDELAVVGFDGAARDAMPTLVVVRTPDDRARIKQAVRAVGNDGNWTDFTAGLEGARRLLEGKPRAPGDQDLIVFLTDGRCDPDPRGPLADAARAAGGKTRVEQVCQTKVLDDLVPSLGKTRIYAVGLSKSAPRAFLEDLGRRTGGIGVATDRPDELPRLFADIYARLFGSRLSEGASAPSISVPVDEGASSLDLVLVGPPKLGMRLFDPKGAEVSTAGDRPGVYFSDNPAYRLLRLDAPEPGAYRLDVSGGGTGGRYAVLQNLDLHLTFPGLPEVLEIGKSATIKLRLATPGGKAPSKTFLDRHAFSLVSVEGANTCDDATLASAAPVPLRSLPDGSFEAPITPSKKGALCLLGRMSPGESGVLTREARGAPVRVIPPIHLKAAVAAPFGAVKQDGRAVATISLEGSEVGELIFADLEHEHLENEGNRSGMRLSDRDVEIGPATKKQFDVTLDVGRDMPPGPREITLRIVPKKPQGFEDRAVSVRVPVTIVPLTFWERHGRNIQIFLVAFFTFFLVIGLMLPARFRRTAILHYEDRRDPDLPRQAKFPLGAKARAGLYRSARVTIGPMGPVPRGGVVELRAGPGGAVLARPAAGKRATELPRDDDFSAGEPREPRLVNGWFRVSPGVKYAIEGTGLVFWWSPR
ncbi:vWA domain-containing protein [Polyangium jinanense]|uniref:VWA domain-containing protein n=1 Tax=Polyangium jinanense TaxID=2829994 RepID=A0A9X3XB62_9BACT|nr:vWA domain-containing protein [Polyangium jinanense]MDC3959502.1 VWA domain-containing protein [Polyangium jinanense]MDC3986100.1 VWA domain-containing protein [Polyangium jinanense]